MQKFNFLFLAVIAVLLNSCQPKENPPVSSPELVGRWNAVKLTVDGEIETEGLEFVFMQFNANGTCVFNLEGLGEDDDVEANYSYSNGILKLSIDEDDLLCEVIELTSTKLVVHFPPLEEDEDDFTIHFQKAQ